VTRRSLRENGRCEESATESIITSRALPSRFSLFTRSYGTEMWRLHEEQFWPGRSEFLKSIMSACLPGGDMRIPFFGLPTARERYQKIKSKMKDVGDISPATVMWHERRKPTITMTSRVI
jgi:hypothetical protein